MAGACHHPHHPRSHHHPHSHDSHHSHPDIYHKKGFFATLILIIRSNHKPGTLLLGKRPDQGGGGAERGTQRALQRDHQVIVVIHNVLLNHSGKKITGENICRCFGNEKCLAEFELLDMSPGSKLHGLGNLLCTLF